MFRKWLIKCGDETCRCSYLWCFRSRPRLKFLPLFVTLIVINYLYSIFNASEAVLSFHKLPLKWALSGKADKKNAQMTYLPCPSQILNSYINRLSRFFFFFYTVPEAPHQRKWEIRGGPRVFRRKSKNQAFKVHGFNFLLLLLLFLLLKRWS